VHLEQVAALVEAEADHLVEDRLAGVDLMNQFRS
jgi:hypothetical protein